MIVLYSMTGDQCLKKLRGHVSALNDQDNVRRGVTLLCRSGDCHLAAAEIGPERFYPGAIDHATPRTVGGVHRRRRGGSDSAARVCRVLQSEDAI